MALQTMQFNHKQWLNIEAGVLNLSEVSKMMLRLSRSNSVIF